MFKALIIKLRDARRIRRYLKRQDWYDSFKRIASNKSQIEYLSIIYGFKGLFTVSGASPWENTLQGFAFWHRINREFTYWYYYGEE